MLPGLLELQKINFLSGITNTVGAPPSLRSAEQVGWYQNFPTSTTIYRKRVGCRMLWASWSQDQILEHHECPWPFSRRLDIQSSINGTGSRASSRSRAPPVLSTRRQFLLVERWAWAAPGSGSGADAV